MNGDQTDPDAGRRPSAPGPIIASQGDLDDLVDAYVKPGMTVYLHHGAQAWVRSIIRVFKDRGEADLTAVMVQGGYALPDLIAAGVVRRVIAGSIVNPAVPSGRFAVIDDAFLSGRVEFELWSLHSLTLRLMAGAMQWPFVPCNSLIDSDIEVANSLSCAHVAAPFAPDESSLVIAPLIADIALIHAAVGDTLGHVASQPPIGDDLWGARGSRGGVLATVERLLDPAEMHAFSPVARVPSKAIRSVAEAPFASHPYESPVSGAGSDGYVRDDQFLAAYRRAVSSVDGHHAWLAKWVDEPRDQTAYLNRVGEKQLEEISMTRPRTVVTASEFPAWQRFKSSSAPVQRAALVGARHIVRGARSGAVDTVLVGVGAAKLACELAATVLKLDSIALSFVIGNGRADVDMTLDTENQNDSAFAVSSSIDIYGTLLRQAKSLAVLSAAQIDLQGNLNVSQVTVDGIPHLLTGSGGANDAVSSCGNVLVVTTHRPGRFVDRVDFITCPGSRVTAVISEAGELRPGPDGFRLAGVWLDSAHSSDELVDRAGALFGRPATAPHGAVLERVQQPEEFAEVVRFCA